MEVKISAIIIAKNEEKMIVDCIKSLSWVSEIIVIDNGSTDKTELLAKRLKAKIVKNASGSFSDLRNRGSKEASGEWLLYIDADERVTPKLRQEIQRLITQPSSLLLSAYAIPRKNNLLGHDMRWGGWWPDYVLRLVKKDRLIKWEGELHEQPKIMENLPEGRQIGKLKNPLYHITHQSLTEMVEKTNDWSEIEAKLMFKSGHPPMNIPRFASAMFREFWYRAILKLGFLDGPIGIIEIYFQVFSRFVSYAKLWEMQITKR
jgi:glycosyltransferase involved in cell wall biosynthesis